jgi:septum formation protein
MSASPVHDFIYLASQSPRRRQLLEQLGVRHELLLPGPDEDAEALEAEIAGELPLDYVERVTRAKLQVCRARDACKAAGGT